MKKDMTTFEMAQAVFENPGKVFVRKDDGLCVTWSLCSKTLIYPHSGHTVDLHYCQRSNYVWNEKVEPLRGSYEFEAEANRTGSFEGFLTFKFTADVIRQAVAGNPDRLQAVAGKRFKVIVNVEEIV